VHDLGDPDPPPARTVEPLDIAAMADGLVAVLTDETLRDDLAARGSSFAAARTWRATADMHVRLWRQLA
jgi:hypothetical protein